MHGAVMGSCKTVFVPGRQTEKICRVFRCFASFCHHWQTTQYRWYNHCITVGFPNQGVFVFQPQVFVFIAEKPQGAISLWSAAGQKLCFFPLSVMVLSLCERKRGSWLATPLLAKQGELSFYLGCPQRGSSGCFSFTFCPAAMLSENWEILIFEPSLLSNLSEIHNQNQKLSR